MTRNEAAAKVNEAFKAAKVSEAVSDPKADGFTVKIEGHEDVSYTFKYGAHAHEQRKEEVAKLRLALVGELVAVPSLLKRSGEVEIIDEASAGESKPQ